MKKYRYFFYSFDYRKIRKQKFIVRFCPTEYVTIHEDVDFPEISINTDRLGGGRYFKPTGGEFEKVRQVKEDDFYNYFSVSLDVFKSLIWDVSLAAYFIRKPSHNQLECIMFSNDKENRYRVEIRIDASVEEVKVELEYNNIYRGQEKLREKAIFIDEPLFDYILTETINFIKDDRNYQDNVDPYTRLIQDACEGNIRPLLAPKNRIDFNPLMLSLENNIRLLESRLMNNDEDSKEARENVRGKIDGLKMAIGEIRRTVILALSGCDKGCSKIAFNRPYLWSKTLNHKVLKYR